MGDNSGLTMLDNVYATAHAQHTVRSWRRVNQLVQSKTFIIDGSSLDIATVVALARFAHINSEHNRLGANGNVVSVALQS